MAKDAARLEEQAQRIKGLRALARVSQQKAANEIGVSVRAYADWEAARSDISRENLKALAGYYATSPDYIEYGVVDPKRATPDPLSLVDRLGHLEEGLTRIEQKLDQLIVEDGDRYSALTKQERELLERFEELIQQIGRDIGRERPQSRGAKQSQAASA